MLTWVDKLNQFFSMEGYGPYVWAAFGFTIASLILLYWQSWRQARKRAAEAEALRAEVRPREARRPRRAVVRPAEKHGA